MASTPHDLHDALTGGLAYRTGEFRYDVSTDTWWWSDEVFRMHGFEPGELVPTTAMILAHKHPEDRERYAGALASTSLNGGCFGSVHRILDATGVERVLATIGEAHVADDGTVLEIRGHFVDVTGSVHGLAGAEATRQIRAADEHRAVIDQATGVLVRHTGRSPDEMFELLRETSMRSNVKVRDLARQVVDTAATGSTVLLDTLAPLTAEGLAESAG
ncbi:putative PAS/PAC sensor protein [Xylanimonas cellulosilytica DSM 15894]|uniref:PAS/PAC sensor protein n=1 Tax=Xylanimonas cellulosilytica (strain DSM 15894 / JCM 12276 / CECT 5975 / KCTC 9989 / LMG 20990 / NBRC 107835 / XIL07) TaxID=446471 RepID=D1BRH7_XYLCX|nr:PAS and ANTAR domain-containing protein [Xylanimonas cellulosilytica]ACZ30432.1 putative PAS/PAC sensor protein [Xylanimonas cellulosilytica DSM 15894]